MRKRRFFAHPPHASVGGRANGTGRPVRVPDAVVGGGAAALLLHDGASRSPARPARPRAGTPESRVLLPPRPYSRPPRTAAPKRPPVPVQGIRLAAGPPRP